MSIGSISLFLAALVLLIGLLLLPSLAMAQQLQQQQQTIPPSVTTSQTTTSLTSPLTPQEQEQQARLQNVIAATTRDLNETEKEVSGVVFTPRWSEPVWVNANSIAVIIAYCLPGEFADSGQEILGGFELEVLESYAIDLPQGFMAWMAVVGNQDDVQDGRRFPAAVGVICASDLNQADTRILSPQEQQQINNINQQFTNIQNTQITNIDQVMNIINNVTSNTTTTTPPQNGTGGEDGGGMTQPPPTNDTGITTVPPLQIEIIANTTEAYLSSDGTATIKFEAKITGGKPPYCMPLWNRDNAFYGRGFPLRGPFEATFDYPGTYTVYVTVCDSNYYDTPLHQTAFDDILVTIKEPPEGGGEVLLPPETGEEGQPLGGGLLPRTVPPTNDTGAASASATEPPLRVEAIANATQAVAPATIKLDANITGGAPPYSYSWSDPNLGLIDQDRSITLNFFEPGTFTYTLTVTDSRGKVVTDNVQIVISERLPQGGIVAPEPEGIAPPPPIEGQLPSVPEGGEGGVTEESEEGVSPPSTTEEGGGGGEEPPAPPPPSDGTEEGEGTPPSITTDEEPTIPPG
jgi:hypothetical protein